jgi:hypothetical protein
MLIFVCSVFVNWVCWVRGNCSGEPGHVYFVCVSPLCGVPCWYNFNWALRWCGRRDCTDFLFFLALQWLVRYGSIGEGGGPFFLCFLQFAVSSLGGWMSAVGILCYIFFVGSFVVFSRGFLFYKLLIFQQFITGGFVAVRT